MANNREFSQFGSLVEVSNEATSIKVGLAEPNVGIGTTNPTERLEVHGNIKVVGGSLNVGSSGTFTEETQFNAGVGIADSIFHVGDVDTQIRFPADDIVSVETAGSERLRVESGGGIGIGDSIYHLGDTNTQVRFPGADTFTVETAGSERFRVGSNGYVSVGKGAQGDELLHVGSSSTISPAIKVENDQGSLIIGRRQTSRFGIGTDGHVIQSDGDKFAVGTSDGEDFIIGTNNENRITVKSNGRVGIGTNDPDELLEVLGKAKVIDLVASNLSVSSGIGTFQNLKVTGDLTVEGTTTTLDTTLIGVDRVEVGANSNSIVGVAVTQSGTADILKLFNGAGTEVLGITTGGNVTIQNTDAGSSAAPEFKLFRNSASPADADYLGQIKFAGESDTGVERNYAKITGKILDASNGTEDGIIEFAHIKAGSQNISARFRSDSLQLLNGTAFSVAGDITANGNIQGDGSTNISSINDITAGGVLTIDGVSDLDELVVAGVSTFSGNIFVGAAATVGFGTHVSFRDTAKAVFGASSDLQIYHDGTDSIINNTSGDLYLQTTGSGDDIIIRAADDVIIQTQGSEGAVVARGNGTVELYYNNQKKFETTGLGVTVSGNLGVRTDLTVDGITDLDELKVAGVSTFSSGGSFAGRLNVGASDLNNRAINAINTSTTAGAVSANNHNANGILFQGYNSSVDANHASFVVESDGSTGIGTGVAGAPLHVYANVYPTAKITRDHAVNYPALLLDNLSGRGCHLEAVSDDPGGGFRVMTVVGSARTERLRVHGSGKIGINEASPDALLHITNNAAAGIKAGLRFESSGTSNSANDTMGQIEFAHADSTDAGVSASIICKAEDTAGNTYLQFNNGKPSASTEKLRITSTGKIGVGGAPAANWHSAASSNVIQVGSSVLFDYSSAQFDVGHNYYYDGSNYKFTNTGYAGRITFSKSDGSIRFWSLGTGSADANATLAENLHITSAGSIGTKGLVPTDGSFVANSTIRSQNSSSHISYVGFTAYSGNTTVGSMFSYMGGDGRSTGYLNFSTNDTERLRITSAGKVGINTTAPNANLTVGPVNSPTFNRGSVAIKAVQDDNSLPANIYLEELSGAEGYTLSIDSNGDLNFHNSGAAAPTVTFADDDKVGIEESTPLVTLHVGGTDAIRVPSGTTAQRPTGAVGYIRYNSSIASYEGHNGSEWAGIGGAAEVETAVSSTSATTCESFAKASYRSASIVAQITQGSSYQVGNYLLIHDGTTATLVEESAVATGDMLGTFTATISGSNVVFQVNMSSASSATVTTKMTKVSIP